MQKKTYRILKLLLSTIFILPAGLELALAQTPSSNDTTGMPYTSTNSYRKEDPIPPTQVPPYYNGGFSMVADHTGSVVSPAYPNQVYPNQSSRQFYQEQSYQGYYIASRDTNPSKPADIATPDTGLMSGEQATDDQIDNGQMMTPAKTDSAWSKFFGKFSSKSKNDRDPRNVSGTKDKEYVPPKKQDEKESSFFSSIRPGKQQDEIDDGQNLIAELEEEKSFSANDYHASATKSKNATAKNLYSQGMQQEAEGNFEGAIRSYNGFIQNNKKQTTNGTLAAPYHRLALIAWQQQEFEKTDLYFRYGLRYARSGNIAVIAGDYSLFLVEQRKIEQAEIILRNSMLHFPKDDRLKVSLGRVLAQQNRPIEALRYMSEALGDDQAYQELALVYHMQGNYEMARRMGQKRKVHIASTQGSYPGSTPGMSPHPTQLEQQQTLQFAARPQTDQHYSIPRHAVGQHTVQPNMPQPHSTMDHIAQNNVAHSRQSAVPNDPLPMGPPPVMENARGMVGRPILMPTAIAMPTQAERKLSAPDSTEQKMADRPVGDPFDVSPMTDMTSIPSFWDDVLSVAPPTPPTQQPITPSIPVSRVLHYPAEGNTPIYHEYRGEQYPQSQPLPTNAVQNAQGRQVYVSTAAHVPASLMPPHSGSQQEMYGRPNVPTSLTNDSIQAVVPQQPLAAQPLYYQY